MKRTYYPNYFSIEDIFVTQEKIPCTAEQKLSKLGFLDPSSSDSIDLQAGQNVELPLWYILQVQTDKSRNQFYKVHIPDIYKSTYGEICRADATAIDLGKLNKYFYEFGRYVAAFDRNGFVGKMIYEVLEANMKGREEYIIPDEKITKITFQTCRSRMKYLKDLCNNINSETRNDHKLDYIELQLFEVGSKTNRNLYEWLQKNTINIKTSEMVINHRKRRRALMEAENAVSASQRSQS